MNGLDILIFGLITVHPQLKVTRQVNRKKYHHFRLFCLFIIKITHIVSS